MTGKKFDEGKAQLSLLPYGPLSDVARVLGFGAEKYAKNNWRKGMAWSRLYDAALRHILAAASGEDADPETGLPHEAHAICCLLFLLEYRKTRGELDDRL